MGVMFEIILASCNDFKITSSPIPLMSPTEIPILMRFAIGFI
jgi:hypothetical protein